VCRTFEMTHVFSATQLEPNALWTIILRRSVTPTFKLHTQSAYAITCLGELTIPIIGNSSCLSKTLFVTLSHRLLVVCAIRHVTLSALTQIFLLALPDCRLSLDASHCPRTGWYKHWHAHKLSATHLVLIFVSTGSRVCSRHISSALPQAVQCALRKRWRSVFLGLWQFLSLFVKILATFTVHTWTVSTREAGSSNSLSQRKGWRLKQSKNENV
jgi:hypothetical protein